MRLLSQGKTGRRQVADGTVHAHIIAAVEIAAKLLEKVAVRQ